MEGFGPIQAEVGGHRVEATEQVSADGHLHSDNGVWMSWHVAVLTPARWDACDGRPLAGPTALSAVCERRFTERSRPSAWIVGQTILSMANPSSTRATQTDFPQRSGHKLLLR